MKRARSSFYRFIAPVLGVMLSATVLAGCARHFAGTLNTPKSAGVRDEGVKAFSHGDRELALEMFWEALRIDRSVDDRAHEVIDLVNIGRVYISLGRHREAIDVLNEAVRLGKESGQGIGLSEAYATLARAEHLSGEPGIAFEHMEESLHLDESSGIKSGSRLNLQGYILMASGRYAEAEDVLGRALRINASKDDALETANSYRGLAEIRMRSGPGAEALIFYEKAYMLDLVAGDSAKIAADLMKMAELNLKEGRPSQAVFLFERSYLVSINSGSIASAMEAVESIIEVSDRMGYTERGRYYRKIKDDFSDNNNR